MAKQLPPAGQFTLAKHISKTKPENAAAGGSHISSVTNCSPKKRSAGTSLDSLSYSTVLKETFAGSTVFRKAFADMLTLLKNEDIDSMNELFSVELGSGKGAMAKILERLGRLLELFDSIKDFDDDKERKWQKIVLGGFDTHDWNRAFHDFIAAELSRRVGTDSRSVETDYGSV